MEGGSGPAFWAAWCFFISLSNAGYKTAFTSFPRSLSAFHPILKNGAEPSLLFTVCH